ncbi:choline dehydrogenase [Massilia sp. Dwa41.01b]|nr:choline dehydrogenase [Massilia sp. Dwa41.01b]QNB01425.1 choline dehydrogenase [Massilia sp. Se16.2.3]
MPYAWLALLFLGAPAFATEADTPTPTTEVVSPLSFNTTIASQYVSRGFRQTWGKPAAQAGVDYAHASGWSAGAWASNVSRRYVEGARFEVDLYGGYSGTAGPLGVSLMAYYYAYPGALIKATGTRFNYGEVSAGLAYKALYAKYNVTFTRDFFGITNARGTGYLDSGANVDLGHATTLNLHAGEGRVAGAGNDYWNWRDVKIGVTRKFTGGWSGAAAFTRAFGATHAYDSYTTGVPDTSGHIAFSNPAKNTFVVSLTRTF